MRDALGLKKGVQFFILSSPVGLNREDFGVKLAFN
jgi:hypothetical protein